jgi:hypothetical protein
MDRLVPAAPLLVAPRSGALRLMMCGVMFVAASATGLLARSAVAETASFAAVAAASPAGARPTAVAGTWALTVETSAGTGTPTVVLQQDGESLSGTYRGRFGTHPLTGTLKGDAIMFAFTVSGPMGSAEVTYTGTVAGDTMKGTLRMGEQAGGRFTGRRQ